MLDLPRQRGIMVVRIRGYGSMGRAKGVLSCHFIKQKKIFNVHLVLAILSVLWHTIPSYERYKQTLLFRDEARQG